MGPNCLVLNEARRRFIAGAYIRTNYGTSGELKGAKESTNGARERKTSYKQHGPFKPAMFPNPTKEG